MNDYLYCQTSIAGPEEDWDDIDELEDELEEYELFAEEDDIDDLEEEIDEKKVGPLSYIVDDDDDDEEYDE